MLSIDELMPSRQPDEVLGDIVRRSRRQRRRRAAIGASPLLVVALILGLVAMPGGSSLSLDTAPATGGDDNATEQAVDATAEDSAGAAEASRDGGSGRLVERQTGTRPGGGAGTAGSATAASPVVTLPGQSDTPAPQPDLTLPALTNDPVVFVSERGGRRGIWTMEADGARPRLVVDDADAREPALSPDGTQVAYVTSLRTDDPYGKLYVVPRAGGEPRVVHSSSDYGISAPDWSPDGSTFLFIALPKAPGVSALNDNVNAGANPQIRAVRVDGTAERVVLDDDATEARWSPDGSRIVFHRAGAGVFTVNSDGTDQRHVANGASPAWSPDGRIVFSLNSNIVVMDSDGANKQAITAAPEGVLFHSPSWSADGKAIVASKQSPSGCTVGTTENCDVPRIVVIMRPDGSGHRTISSSSADWGPRFPAFRTQPR